MNKEIEKYYAHGKFLLTAEYLVMAGADAIVLPLNKGQHLSLLEDEHEQLRWESWYEGELWFQADFNAHNFDVLETEDQFRAAFISRILKEAKELAKKEKSFQAKKIITELEFSPDWGLGSSSTLIVNVSRLFDINAFDLHKRVSRGSGFDVAAGMSTYPFRYRLKKNKREMMPVRIPELFFNHTFFVYLGQKADSGIAVEEFSQQDKDLKIPVKYINEISGQFTEVESVRELSRITNEHEQFMSDVLGMPSPTDRFADYPYGMKSLGAWGGDFIMAIHPKGKQEVERYFKHKGCPLVFSANELKIS